VSDIDPFALDFLEDPYPYHHDLREAGPVVWLEKYCIFAPAVDPLVRTHAVSNAGILMPCSQQRLTTT